MTRLLINIDHVATLRNARREAFPDPVAAAILCETAGADGIVFHLREDRRHIVDADVERLRALVQGKLDFEHSLDPGIVETCCRTRPHLATLVPERREEVTTEGGLDVRRQLAPIRDTVLQLHDAGIGEVALFVDPDLDQIAAVPDTGADAIELHTGEFANASTAEAQTHQAGLLADAARLAHQCGLAVHAGHGLNYRNYPAFASAVPHIAEVSIGFAIVARAVFCGLYEAVRDMARLVRHPYGRV